MAHRCLSPNLFGLVNSRTLESRLKAGPLRWVNLWTCGSAAGRICLMKFKAAEPLDVAYNLRREASIRSSIQSVWVPFSWYFLARVTMLSFWRLETCFLPMWVRNLETQTRYDLYTYENKHTHHVILSVFLSMSSCSNSSNWNICIYDFLFVYLLFNSLFLI